jgi:hypothetical protein
MHRGYTGCLRRKAQEWGISLDGADIGAIAEYLSDKSEAARRKNDSQPDVRYIEI